MKFLFSLLIAFSVFSVAHAGGQEMIKTEFKCSILADYSVYIVKTTGLTNSYKLAAFCLDLNDDGIESCLEDEDDDTYTCFEEFKQLNKLGAGDGELKIVHGRE